METQRQSCMAGKQQPSIRHSPGMAATAGSHGRTRSRAAFQSLRSLPAPCRSAPYQISRLQRQDAHLQLGSQQGSHEMHSCHGKPAQCAQPHLFVDSSKKAFTWHGSPVLTGSGRKQNAVPSTGEAVPAIRRSSELVVI